MKLRVEKFLCAIGLHVFDWTAPQVIVKEGQPFMWQDGSCRREGCNWGRRQWKTLDAVPAPPPSINLEETNQLLRVIDASLDALQYRSSRSSYVTADNYPVCPFCLGAGLFEEVGDLPAVHCEPCGGTGKLSHRGCPCRVCRQRQTPDLY